MKHRSWYTVRYREPEATIYLLNSVKFRGSPLYLVSVYSTSFGQVYYDIGEENIMAKRAFDQIEFVRCPLSTASKKKFKIWEETARDDLFTYLEQILLSGIRVSLSYSHKDATCIVSLTDRDEASINHEKCVSSRHADPLTAVMVAVYKHFEVLKDSDWSEYAKEDEWG